jgi:uncharacterized protein
VSVQGSRALTLLAAVGLGIVAASAAADSPTQPRQAYGLNDIPKEFEDTFPNKDYVRRVEMVPMRDGVKLQTIILVPKGAQHAPIVLTRTPYNATARAQVALSASLLSTLPPADADFVGAGYIRVYQDTRGKYGSEGDYVMLRPIHGPLNPTSTDHTTDAWDTVDWLVKNIPESNGRVGMIGSSYEGFTVLMALLDPHPALEAAVPESPVVDGWMGDDWFHYGAFRNLMLGYVHMQTAQHGAGVVTPSETYDKYEEYLRAGSTGDYVRSRGLDKLPYVARMMAHRSRRCGSRACGIRRTCGRTTVGLRCGRPVIRPITGWFSVPGFTARSMARVIRSDPCAGKEIPRGNIVAIWCCLS